MPIFKNKYFLIIQSIKDIDLRKIKIANKFSIIYRNINKLENINKLLKFRKLCKIKRINFFVANNAHLAIILMSDGIYISAKNSDLRLTKLKKLNFKLIGSAHNIRELNTKVLQGCTDIFFSRLFKTSYKFKKGFLGVVKFNLLNLSRKENLTPLGGIRLSNLNQLKLVSSSSFALMSEVKKKPAILSRLF